MGWCAITRTRGMGARRSTALRHFRVEPLDYLGGRALDELQRFGQHLRVTPVKRDVVGRSRLGIDAAGPAHRMGNSFRFRLSHSLVCFMPSFAPVEHFVALCGPIT